MMFDAHGHLSDSRLTAIAENLVIKLQEAGLNHIMLGGVEPLEWGRQFDLAKQYPAFVTPVVGIHPWTVRDSADRELEDMFVKLSSIANSTVALGEMGVDFYRDNSQSAKEHQAKWCKRQLDLASSLNKPVVLHVVQGHDVMQALLKDFKGRCAMVHGYRGNNQTAKFYTDRGFVLSLGMRSCKGFEPQDYQWVPRTNFVIESDAPDYKAKGSSVEEIVNQWISDLNGVADFLAKAWKIDVSEVWALARRNKDRFLTEI